MKFLKFTILSILLGANVQVATAQKEVSYSGMVSSKDHQAVYAADVALRSLNSNKIITYTTTDSLGKFELKVKPNKYSLEVYHLLYESHIDTVDINEQSPEVKILMNPTINELNEIVITARKPLFYKKIDRLVINVAERPLFSGSNSFDLLKSAPGVYASNGDQLQLLGKTGMRIMLNGRMQNLNQNEITEFLRSLSSDEIETIEIITTPPAKYEAEGGAGIINIITKKNIDKGWYGNINLTGYQGRNTRIIGQTGLQYQANKVNATLSYNTGIVNSFEELDQYNILNFSGSQIRYNSEGFEDRELLYNVLRSQIDIKTSKNSLFSVAARASSNQNDQPSTNDTFQYDEDGMLVDFFQTLTDENEKRKNFSSDLYYEYVIDTLNKKISFTANYAEFKTLNNQLFSNFFNQSDNTDDEKLRSDFDNKTIIKAVKVDVTLPYDNVLIETGARYSVTNAGNSFLFENFQDGLWVTNSDISNDFLYEEHNTALYVSIQKQLSDSWEFKAGLRGEFSTTEGFSPTLNQITEYDYFKLFPTLYIQYKATENYKLDLTYSRRINRPGFSSLNPFVTYQNPLFSNEGNPLLRPEFTHSIEFNNIISNKYIITPFYNLTQGYYSEFPKNIEGTTETRYTFGNLGNNKNYGIQAVIPFKFNDKISLQQTLLGMYQTYDLSFDGISQSPEGFFWLYQFALNLSISEKLKADIYGNYQSKNIQAFYRVRESADLGVALRYSFLKDKASLNIGFYDILYTNRSIVDIEYPNQSLGFTRYNDTRLIKIGFSYRFGRKDLDEKASFNSASQEEQSRN
jgi:hypothetical protein